MRLPFLTVTMGIFLDPQQSRNRRGQQLVWKVVTMKEEHQEEEEEDTWTVTAVTVRWLVHLFHLDTRYCTC